MSNTRITYFAYIGLITFLFAYCNASVSTKSIPKGIIISEFMANNDSISLGQNQKTPDWIELWNNSENDIDLSGLFISDNPNKLRKTELSGVMSAGEYLILYSKKSSSEMPMVNFKLNKKGGSIYLSNGTDNITQKVRYNRQLKNVSMTLDGEQWKYCLSPSPGNNSDPLTLKSALSQDVSCKFNSAENQVTAELSSDHKGTIYYTTDGSDPFSESALKYEGLIQIKNEGIIRARLQGEEIIDDKEQFFAYVPTANHTLPIVSVMCKPEYLWDEQVGIYHSKNCGSKDPKWTRTATFEFFDKDTTFRDKIDLKIFGNATRSKPKKSFSVKSKGFMPNVFFENNTQKKLDGVVLRACHTSMTKYRNELVKHVNDAVKSSMDMQEYEPAAVYVNGKYWGVYNIYERKNDEFIKDHYGFKPEAMCRMNERQIKEDKGNIESLEKFFEAIKVDMTDAEFEKLFEATFHQQSVLDFWCHDFIIARVDSYNNRFWLNPETQKWQVISFDYDICLGKFDNTRIFDKYVDELDDYGGLHFINRAFACPNIKEKIVFRMVEILNSGYTHEVISPFLKSYENHTRAEFLLDTARWNKENYKVRKSSFRRDFDMTKNSVKRFTEKRKSYLFDEFFAKHGFSQQVEVKLPEDSLVQVKINDLPVYKEVRLLAGMTVTFEINHAANKAVDGAYFNGQKIPLGEEYKIPKSGVIEVKMSE